jgi:hypothetical protein
LGPAKRAKTAPEVVVVEAIAEACPAIRASMVSFRLTKAGRLASGRHIAVDARR